jgi:hypothetical protein
VRVDVVSTEGERGVLENLQRKAKAADKMFSRWSTEMNRRIGIAQQSNFQTGDQVPKWL